MRTRDGYVLPPEIEETAAPETDMARAPTVAVDESAYDAITVDPPKGEPLLEYLGVTLTGVSSNRAVFKTPHGKLEVRGPTEMIAFLRDELQSGTARIAIYKE